MIDELRRLGHETVQAWVQRREQMAAQQFRTATPTAIGMDTNRCIGIRRMGRFALMNSVFMRMVIFSVPFPGRPR